MMEKRRTRTPPRAKPISRAPRTHEKRRNGAAELASGRLEHDRPFPFIHLADNHFVEKTIPEELKDGIAGYQPGDPENSEGQDEEIKNTDLRRNFPRTR